MNNPYHIRRSVPFDGDPSVRHPDMGNPRGTGIKPPEILIPVMILPWSATAKSPMRRLSKNPADLTQTYPG
jgi:hypothetical protein